MSSEESQDQQMDIPIDDQNEQLVQDEHEMTDDQIKREFKIIMNNNIQEEEEINSVIEVIDECCKSIIDKQIEIYGYGYNDFEFALTTLTGLIQSMKNNQIRPEAAEFIKKQLNQPWMKQRDYQVVVSLIFFFI